MKNCATPKSKAGKVRFLKGAGIGATMVAGAAAALLCFSNLRQPTPEETAPEEIYGLENTALFEARYPGELEMIVNEVERRKAMYPEVYGPGIHGGLIADVMATRWAENGRPGREYGILPETEGYAGDMGVVTPEGPMPYGSSIHKQIAWCVGDWQEKNKDYLIPGEGTKADYVDETLWTDPDFIREQAEEYAPVGAPNDPGRLNGNWERNVLDKVGEYSKDL
jgi:hypothetical protein